MEKNEAAVALGSLGGRASAEKRLSGMTVEQKSEHMRSVRLSAEKKKRLLEIMTEEQKES